MIFFDRRERFRQCVAFVGLLVWVWLGVGIGQPAAADPVLQTARIKAVIQEKLGMARPPDALWLGCERIHASQDLIDFYAERDFSPVWVNAQGIRPQGRTLPHILQTTQDHGLNPEAYHLSCIRGLLEVFDKFRHWEQVGPVSDPELPAQLDILLTDGFLVSLSHLAAGSVSPKTLYPQWLAPKQKADILAGLTGFDSGRGLQDIYTAFSPSCPQYQELVRAGIRLRRIVEQGGWPMIEPGPLLRCGDQDIRVFLLRQRLDQTHGRPAAVGALSLYFDQGLEAKVKQFQSRHGLKVDGIIGDQTRQALNVSAHERRRTVLVNLERLRWLACDPPDRSIRVNIADFSLQGYEEHQRSLRLKAIVGKEYTKTPVFRKQLQYIVLNPYWNVPRSIAVKEILPKVKNDAEYLEQEHIQVLSGWDNPSLLEPETIDWSRVDAETFSWRFRQQPGPWNSLGRIKFIFPNPFHVYIHDTPNKGLFKRQERAFSHGCIRVQHPVRLADFVLQDDPQWTVERILEIFEARKRKVIVPSTSCLVDLTYRTAWVDETGDLQFRNDVYNRDQSLWKALHLQPEPRKHTPPLVTEPQDD